MYVCLRYNTHLAVAVIVAPRADAAVCDTDIFVPTVVSPKYVRVYACMHACIAYMCVYIYMCVHVYMYAEVHTRKFGSCNWLPFECTCVCH